MDAEPEIEGRRAQEINLRFAPSIGLIAIRNSPICWVNSLVSRDDRRRAVYRYHNLYLVYDSSERRSGLSWGVRVRTTLFGRLVDVRWEGELDNDLIQRLEQDVWLSHILIRLKEDIEIHSRPEQGPYTWVIMPSSHTQTPSREQWDCYETIARHLLKSSGK